VSLQTPANYLEVDRLYILAALWLACHLLVPTISRDLLAWLL